MVYQQLSTVPINMEDNEKKAQVLQKFKKNDEKAKQPEHNGPNKNNKIKTAITISITHLALLF